jgi:hypothetical protein
VGRDVHDALHHVRELATSIYPPLLPSRGLGDALRAAGATVRVDGALPRYPPEVEASVYFFCVELPSAGVRLWNDDHALRFELTTDEIPSAARDRILALGGRLESANGCVSGSIPAQPLSAR